MADEVTVGALEALGVSSVAELCEALDWRPEADFKQVLRYGVCKLACMRVRPL